MAVVNVTDAVVRLDALSAFVKTGVSSTNAPVVRLFAALSVTEGDQVRTIRPLVPAPDVALVLPLPPEPELQQAPPPAP